MPSSKKRIRTRDYYLVQILTGATKAGIHKDRKKEENKRKTRKKVDKDDHDE